VAKAQVLCKNGDRNRKKKKILKKEAGMRAPPFQANKLLRFIVQQSADAKRYRFRYPPGSCKRYNYEYEYLFFRSFALQLSWLRASASAADDDYDELVVMHAHPHPHTHLIPIQTHSSSYYVLAIRCWACARSSQPAIRHLFHGTFTFLFVNNTTAKESRRYVYTYIKLSQHYRFVQISAPCLVFFFFLCQQPAAIVVAFIVEWLGRRS